jgi:lipoyl(octanoyl) transferase
VSGSSASSPEVPRLRWRGTRPYLPTWIEMQEHAAGRTGDGRDEVWCLEHPPIYTLGAAGRAEHVLAPGDIPVLAVDRGGQVTYHGPGQLVVYPLIDLRRRGLGIRDLISALEEAVVAAVAALGIEARARREAPGVYVDGRKLASVGLRVRRHVSYHGLAVNVAMDLTPFAGINPCGYPGLEVTDLAGLGVRETPRSFAERLLPEFFARARLGEMPPFASETG